MRLSGSLLLQQVDDLLVFVDESSGTEATRPLSLETVMHLIDDVTTARIDGQPLAVDDVRVAPELFDKLLGGLGYFMGRSL